eukprot:scaffold359191_cov18-Prasinocladus_malaysianus.AAC.2
MDDECALASCADTAALGKYRSSLAVVKLPFIYSQHRFSHYRAPRSFSDSSPELSSIWQYIHRVANKPIGPIIYCSLSLRCYHSNLYYLSVRGFGYWQDYIQ